MAASIFGRALRRQWTTLFSTRAFSSAAAFATIPIRATLFPGDVIGPEIADSVKQVSEIPTGSAIEQTRIFLNLQKVVNKFSLVYRLDTNLEIDASSVAALSMKTTAMASQICQELRLM